MEIGLPFLARTLSDAIGKYLQSGLIGSMWAPISVALFIVFVGLVMPVLSLLNDAVTETLLPQFLIGGSLVSLFIVNFGIALVAASSLFAIVAVCYFGRQTRVCWLASRTNQTRKWIAIFGRLGAIMFGGHLVLTGAATIGDFVLFVAMLEMLLNAGSKLYAGGSKAEHPLSTA